MDRLREHDEVTFSLPVAGRIYRVIDFHATVIAVIESGVVLWPVDVDTAMLPERAEDVFMSFVHGRQLVGLKGELTWHESRGLRFSVQDGVDVKRRRFSRVRAELPVTVRRGEESCVGVTVDLAPEGVLLQAPLAVSLGELLKLELAVPGAHEPVGLTARVVRHADGMIALQFIPDQPARAVVAEFVVERLAAEYVSV